VIYSGVLILSDNQNEPNDEPKDNPDDEPQVFFLDDVQREETVRESLLDTIKRLEATIQKQQGENAVLKEDKQNLEEKLELISRVFNRDQIYRLLRPNSKGHWSDETLEMAIKLYYKVGTTGYTYLRDTLNWPLPAPETINWHMRKIEFKPGEAMDIFKLIALKCQDLSEEERHIGLVIDEMSVQPKLEWDSGSGQMVGYPTVPPAPGLVEKRAKEGVNQDDILASHVFNVMIVGLIIKFKNLIANHHTDMSWHPSFIAQWIVALVRNLYSICGLTTLSLIMDMSKMNIAL
jgi:hypothetical protein